MKKIVCFGDSNTFGYMPSSGERYPENIRWSGILKEKLKDKYDVTEAGCNNRTAFIDNPAGTNYTGFKALPLYMNKDTDILILAIGINDIQLFFKPDIQDIAAGIKTLISIAQNINNNVKIILVSPPILTNDILNGSFAFQFDSESIKQSKLLPKLYKDIAKENKCKFINLNDYVKVSKEDGLHYNEQAHKEIAKVMENALNSI